MSRLLPEQNDDRREYAAYVCDKCGDITDAHGEPVGCVNVACDAETMRLTVVVEADRSC